MRLVSFAIVLALVTIASSGAVFAAPIEQETATAAVRYLAETSQVTDLDRLVPEIKALRKRLGKQFVFSVIQVDGAQAGKVLYHPVPFVTGRNVLHATDADGHTHGADALRQAQKLHNRAGLWLSYVIRNPVTSDREERFMFCKRLADRMLCCSFPNTGQLQLPPTPVPADH